MPPIRRVLLSISVGVLAAGCGLLPPPTPDWVTGRTELPACGAEQIAQGGLPNPEARACLLDAWREGRAAELVSERPSVEGDPITTIYRVHPDGSLELFVDSTRDRFGSGEWERLICTGLRPVRAEDGFDDAWVFVEENCGAPEPDL